MSIVYLELGVEVSQVRQGSIMGTRIEIEGYAMIHCCQSLVWIAFGMDALISGHIPSTDSVPFFRYCAHQWLMPRRQVGRAGGVDIFQVVLTTCTVEVTFFYVSLQRYQRLVSAPQVRRAAAACHLGTFRPCGYVPLVCAHVQVCVSTCAFGVVEFCASRVKSGVHICGM